MQKKSNYSHLTEFTASLVVFLVALPLCMGISIASGVPPIYGIISGIIGGIVVGAFSGSPLQVSGPAAGLAVMVYEFVAKFGLAALVPLGIIIGVVQLLAYRFRVGVYFKAVSPALLKGLLCGIGVLIFLSQLYVALDLKPVGTGLVNLLSYPETLYKSLILSQSSLIPFSLCLGTIAIMLAWGKVPGKISKTFPAPLIGVIAASVAANILGLDINFVTIPKDILSELHIASASSLQILSMPLLISSLGISLVASAETLLCTKATDVMSKSGSSDYNKEIMAQGIGHLLAGFLGVIPITGVIVRSTANIESGAKTRISTVLHGVWLLVLVFAAPGILELIPVSALASILIITGIKLMDFKGIVSIVKSSRQNSMIFVSTIALIVSVDLLTGVLAGFGMSLLVLISDLLKLEIETIEEKIVMKGRLSFLQIPQLNSHMSKVEKLSEVVFDLEGLEYMDEGAEDEIKNWKTLFSSQGKTVTIIPPLFSSTLAG